MLLKENISLMAQLTNKIINRLMLYHCLLKYSALDKISISSAEIAELLSLDDSLVRKDIELCGVLGRQRHGYPVKELKIAIENQLGFSKRKEVFILGAGYLGAALAHFADFKDYGIDILALFDNDERKIGMEIRGKRVLDISKLENLIARMGVKNVILTVPPEVAQEVTDYAVKCGVECIWNFTPAILKVPSSVTIYYENVVSSFLQMRNEVTV